MSKVLFFFTSNYPFGKGEPFIENEIPFLSKNFDKIIFVSNDSNNPQTRELPLNAVCKRLSYNLTLFQKIISLLGVFSILFWKELRIIKTIYKQPLTLLKIRTALQTLQKGKKIGKDISYLITHNSNLTDEVFLYSYWTNDIAFAIAFMEKTKNIKNYFSRAHGWDVYFEVNEAKYLPFRKYILENTSGIFFISQKGKDYYTKLFPDLTHKMFVSYLGVPEQSISPFIVAKKFKIISCSYIIPLKQINLIIDALEIIETIEIEWVHFGTGTEEELIKEYAKQKLSKKKNIIYEFKGYVSNNQIHEFYKNNTIDFLINCSITEGIPVSMMEALSYGIPIIGTNVGGVKEIISDSYNGFLMSNLPSKFEVADTIKKFYELSEEEILKMRQNAYNTWGEKFNGNKNYKNFISHIFEEDQKSVIIFVTNYPNGQGELFFESEINSIAAHFKNMYIIATDPENVSTKTISTEIPRNVTVINYNQNFSTWDKLFSLRFLLHKKFIEDILFFKQLSYQFIKIFLFESLKAKKLASFTSNFISNNTIDTHHCSVYSYWNDFMSASVAHLKIMYPELKGYTRAHRWDLYCEENPLHYLPLRKYIYKHLDSIFLISHDGKKYLENLLPQFSTKYVYAPLGTINKLPLQTYKKEKTIVMVSCSSIIPIKNLIVIIDSLSIISNINIHWIHFGNGSDEAIIKEYADKTLHEKLNITYEFKGFTLNDKILEYYNSHQIDFLINCSKNEGIPVSMMEAMSFGIPVLGTNVGGVSEIITDSKNGYLMSPYASKDEVAATITKFCLQTEESILEMRKNAFETWDEKYNAEKNYMKFIPLL